MATATGSTEGRKTDNWRPATSHGGRAASGMVRLVVPSGPISQEVSLRQARGASRLATTEGLTSAGLDPFSRTSGTTREGLGTLAASNPCVGRAASPRSYCGTEGTGRLAAGAAIADSGRGAMAATVDAVTTGTAISPSVKGLGTTKGLYRLAAGRTSGRSLEGRKASLGSQATY